MSVHEGGDPLDRAGIGLVELDESWRIREMNATAAELLGRRADLTGRPAGSVLTALGPSTASERCRETGEAVTFETVLGGERWKLTVHADETGATVLLERSTGAAGSEAAVRSLQETTAALLAADTPEEVYQLVADTAASILPAGDPRVVVGEGTEPVIDGSRNVSFAVGEGALVVDTETAAVADVDLLQVLVRTAEATFDRTRREAELTRQNERLDAFASVVAHDLRNPIAVIEGSLELAAESGREADFERARTGLERMETLVEDLLGLARAGVAVEDPEPVSLDVVAARAWDVSDTEAASLVVETDRVLEADAGRLQQALENLFRNAVEHGSTSSQRPVGADDSVEHSSTSSRPEAGDSVDHGSDAVTVTVGETATGFFVADDGPGIPPDRRAKAFERGYSAGDGTGFGLAIVAEVAGAHGWSVAVTEGRTGGARFEFDVGG